MRVQKWVSTGASVVLLASLLAACGSNNNDSKSSPSTDATPSASPSPAASKDPVTLQFWSALDPSSDQGKAIQQKVKEFDDSHDNINVDLQVISYDVLHDKLVAAINAGDAPDLSWGLGEWFGEFNKLDALADLTASFDSWDQKDKIYTNVLDALKVDGKLKALPNYLGIRALSVPREHFEGCRD